MKLKENKSIQYMIVLAANIGSLGCGFLVSIAATHILSTTNYGYYKAFQNSLLMLSSFSIIGLHYTFGRKYALISTDVQKKKLNFSGIYILGLISILLFIGIWLIQKMLIFVGKPLPEYIMIATVFNLSMLLTYYLQQKFQGSNDMGSYAILIFVPQLILAITFVTCLLNNVVVEAYQAIIFYLLPNIILNLMFIIKQGFKKVSLNYIKNIFVENSDYGMQLYIGSLFSVSTSQILGLMMASISGLEEYAFFSLGDSLAAPMLIIPTTMATVQFKNNVGAKKLSNKDLFVTTGTSALTLIGYVFFLNVFMQMLLGQSYAKSIPYANILVLYYIFLGFGDYLNRFICAKGKGKIIRNGSIVTGITLVVCAVILVPKYQVIGLIISKMMSSIVYLLMMTISYIKVIKDEK